MSDGTKIEWAANADGSPGATWNPIRARNRETGQHGWFCVHKSDGCKLCYAERINARLGTGVDYKAQNLDQVEIIIHENTITQPLRWKKPRTIFVCSMTDLFAGFVPDFMIDQVFAIAALCPQHTFIMLTKRADRLRAYLTGDLEQRNAAIGRLVNDLSPTHVLLRHALPLPNVWLGVSAETQREADERIPDLLATPAAARHASLEPLLGPIDLRRLRRPVGVSSALTFDALYHKDTLNRGDPAPGLDWVIAGGESGHGARPMHPQWARALRDQCAAAGVPFFFKQWGEWAPAAPGVGGQWVALDGRDWRGSLHTDAAMQRVGKRAAGRLLDGVEHSARPPRASERSAP